MQRNARTVASTAVMQMRIKRLTESARIKQIKCTCRARVGLELLLKSALQLQQDMTMPVGACNTRQVGESADLPVRSPQ